MDKQRTRSGQAARMPSKPGSGTYGNNMPSLSGTAVEVGAAQIQQVTGKRILTKTASGKNGLPFQGNQAVADVSAAQNLTRDSMVQQLQQEGPTMISRQSSRQGCVSKISLEVGSKSVKNILAPDDAGARSREVALRGVINKQEGYGG